MSYVATFLLMAGIGLLMFFLGQISLVSVAELLYGGGLALLMHFMIAPHIGAQP